MNHLKKITEELSIHKPNTFKLNFTDIKNSFLCIKFNLCILLNSLSTKRAFPNPINTCPEITRFVAQFIHFVVHSLYDRWFRFV